MTGDIEPPTLWEVSEMSRDFGLVGERASHLSVLVLTINGGLIVLSSPSRSGKDMVVDAVEYCRPGDDIARIPDSSSKTVLYERRAELNAANVHRYPDITDLEDHTERLLKENGDGRTSTHQFTDVSGEERSVVEQSIHPPNSMILFIASDNQKVDLNDYPEVRNRAVIVSTDASAELTEKVKLRQAEMEVGKYTPKTTPERRHEIRQYIGNIPVETYTNSDRSEVWNLTHYALAQENPLPDLFPESRMDFSRFNKFVKSVTLFHHANRMEVHDDSRDAIVSMLTTPKDLWLGWKIFGEQMVLSALNLRDIDFEVLDLLRQSSQTMTVAEVQNEMRRAGHNLSEPQVRGALDGMLDKGYVIKDDSGSRVSYQPSPFATEDNVAKDVTIDFEEIVEQTKVDAREQLDAEAADEYISQFCTGGGLIATHPLTGEQVNITEQDLGDDIGEQAEKEAEVLEEEDPFDSGGGMEGADGGQNTLAGTIG